MKKLALILLLSLCQFNLIANIRSILPKLYASGAVIASGDLLHTYIKNRPIQDKEDPFRLTLEGTSVAGLSVMAGASWPIWVPIKLYNKVQSES